MNRSSTPQFLYKIVSQEDWQNSQGKKTLSLPAFDADFIHFATREQVGQVVRKFWANAEGFFLLRVAYDELEGDCVLEANPGGTNLYYHLYNGAIAMSSVKEATFHAPKDFLLD